MINKFNIKSYYSRLKQLVFNVSERISLRATVFNHKIPIISQHGKSIFVVRI